jgi:hypothetical protein
MHWMGFAVACTLNDEHHKAISMLDRYRQIQVRWREKEEGGGKRREEEGGGGRRREEEGGGGWREERRKGEDVLERGKGAEVASGLFFFLCAHKFSEKLRSYFRVRRKRIIIFQGRRVREGRGDRRGHQVP